MTRTGNGTSWPARLANLQRTIETRRAEFLASGGDCLTCFDAGLCTACERGRAEREAFKASALRDFRDRWLTKAGLSPRMRGFTFDSFPHQADPTFQAVRAFVTHWRWDRGLLLSGGFGTGKTGLIAAALNLLVDWSYAWMETDEGPRSEPRLVCRHTARLYAVPDLFDRLRAGYDDGSFTATMRDCQEADLLILDDLGTEKPTDWVRERLFAIVNHRYEAEKPIWVTTNLGLDALERVAGERVVWRLLETSDVVMADGRNLRERLR